MSETGNCERGSGERGCDHGAAPQTSTGVEIRCHRRRAKLEENIGAFAVWLQFQARQILRTGEPKASIEAKRPRLRRRSAPRAGGDPYDGGHDQGGTQDTERLEREP